MSDADTETEETDAEPAEELAPGGTNPEHADRTTSPMQEYSFGQVTTGALVLLVGLVLTFGVPFLL